MCIRDSFWSVQHDIDGLIDLVGDKNRFAEKLDSMFTYHPAADDELPIFSTGMICLLYTSRCV